MSSKLEIYRCGVCGNVVEVVHAGKGTLWCCGRPLKLFSEVTVDPDQERYFPVVEKTADGVKVVIGDKLHVMEEDHHIQWIEIVGDGLQYRKFLGPADIPEATFVIDARNVRARAYCTRHGLCIER